MSKRLTMPSNAPPVAVAPTYAPAINPRMVKRLPYILEELIEVRHAIEGPLARIKETIGELHDFLEFEANKNELAIKIDGDTGMRRQFAERLRSTQAILDPDETGHIIVLLRELTDDLNIHYIEPLRALHNAKA